MEGSTKVGQPVPYGTNRPSDSCLHRRKENSESNPSISENTTLYRLLPCSKNLIPAVHPPPSHAQISRGKDRVLRENPRFLSEKRMFPEVRKVKVFDSTVGPFLAFEFRDTSLSPPLFCVGSSGLSTDPEKD